MELRIVEIRQLVLQGEMAFTDHAINEALDELISPDEIKEAILEGTIVEDYPLHNRGPCCLVYGATSERERPPRCPHKRP